MDADLLDFLKEAGLDYLTPIFDDNGIDSFATLQQLCKDNSFSSLVLKLGDRLKLKKKVGEIWNDSNVNSTHGQDPEPLNKVILLGTEESAEPIYIQKLQDFSQFKEHQSIDITTELSSTFRNTSPLSKDSTITIDILSEDNFELNQILSTTLMGRAIKEIYRLNNYLSSACQSYLVEIIVQHFINIHPFRRLTNEDFRKIAEAIVKLFPRELPQVYFTSPIKKRNSKDNRSGIARGKLVDKYRNRLTFLRQAKILPSRFLLDDDSTDIQNSQNTDQEHVEEDILWLLHNQDPWNEVTEKWAKTYDYRQRLIKGDLDFSEILSRFPIIKNPLGHSLVDWDFKKKFSFQHQLLYTSFETVFWKLFELKKKNLSRGDCMIVEIISSQNSQANIDSRHYLMLTLLASLLPARTYNRKGKHWYPTLTDAVQGIIVHIKIAAEIESTKEEKKKVLEKYGLPLLPYIITQGPSNTDIEHIYVSFNDILYKVNSVLKGVDVCFQLIHVFNLKYPYESEHIWLFIQLGMYQLNTVYDKIPNILDIVNKIS